MNFKTKHLGQNFQHFKTIVSTQTYLKDLVQKETVPVGTLILADHQEIGKGTQGRSWFSLPEPQLMFSLLLQPILPPHKLPIINILCGVLMAQTLESFDVPAKVKWPNDIYLDGKKCGGILSELITQNQEAYIIVGIGINVTAKTSDFPEELQKQATAISIHKQIDRYEILDLFLQKLEKAVYTWDQNQIIEYSQEQFKKLWLYSNQTIQVQHGSKNSVGKSTQINSTGALELHTTHGIEKILSGTITLLTK